MPTPAALQPLKDATFRGLWLAWLAANLTMWMNDVAAAWLMTSLTTSPVMVALVATASTLPVFLLGLPSGALADIVDRRRYFAATQLWVSIVALLLAALAAAGLLTAPLLLLLTFANGIAMNLSRVIGPVLAGALLAASGPASVFALNVLLAAGAFVLILRWPSTQKASSLPGERFVGALRTGVNFALQSPRLKVILLRIFLFFFQSTALMALLPLVAKRLHGGGPGSFTLMLSCAGVGAIVAALYFPRWRERFDRDAFVRIGTVVHAAISSLVVAVPAPWLALPAMVLLGMAWISVANSLTVSAQMAMPDWVRARGMSIYQMALMGGAAAGSLVWGQVAALVGLGGAVWAAAAFGVVVLAATRRLSVEGGREPDYTPASITPPPEPAFAIAADEGPVMVTVEYQIDPARADAFAAVMQRTRRARLRQGALSWGLFRDVAVPGRYVEYFVDENWVEHQRRLERFTAFDAGLREERLAFHTGPEPPRVRRYVGDSSLQAGEPPPTP